MTGKIYTAIPAIMGEVGAIEKNRKNTAQGTGYSFRGIDDVYAAFQELLAKHGVFVVPQVVHQSREDRVTKSGGAIIYTILKVEFTFYADDGSSFVASTVGEAMDTSDKSANKAMSAALKLVMLEVFCVPTWEPKDSEDDTHDVVPRTKPEDKPVPTPGPAPKVAPKGSSDASPASKSVELITPRPVVSGTVAMVTGITPVASTVTVISREGADYTIPFGTHKGKKLNEIDLATLRTFVLDLEALAESKQTQLTGVTLDFVNRASDYLVRFEKEFGRP